MEQAAQPLWLNSLGNWPRAQAGRQQLGVFFDDEPLDLVDFLVEDVFLIDEAFLLDEAFLDAAFLDAAALLLDAAALPLLAKPFALLAKPFALLTKPFAAPPNFFAAPPAALAMPENPPSSLRLELEGTLAAGNCLIWPSRRAVSTCFNAAALLRRTGMPMNHLGTRSLRLPAGKLR